MVLNSCAAVLTKKESLWILSVELDQIFTANVLVHEKYIAGSHNFFRSALLAIQILLFRTKAGGGNVFEIV